jgi:catechol 2,3-dioxygenase-like lactoylglutathione lyase family enzyme
MSFPSEDMELTQMIVTSDMERATAFYTGVLGAEIYREYGGTSTVLKFLGSWVLLVTGGDPTEDKPGITFATAQDPTEVSRAWTIRVPDCRDAFDELSGRGAQFLTPPKDWGPEIRAFFTDPDGNLIEISESVG